MSEWDIAAKNLMLGRTCDNCRFLLGIDKCFHMPRPAPNLSGIDTYFHCPEIGTCPKWSKA